MKQTNKKSANVTKGEVISRLIIDTVRLLRSLDLSWKKKKKVLVQMDCS